MQLNFDLTAAVMLAGLIQVPIETLLYCGNVLLALCTVLAQDSLKVN